MKAVHARVLVTHSDHGICANESDEWIPFVFKRGLDRALPGDWIDVDEAGRLSLIYERTHVFGRGDHKGQFKPTAANIDQLLIVIAPQPAPSLDLIHRYLAMAELQSIRPLIVVNKSDLGIPANPPFSELPFLSQLGYQVLYASIEDKSSIEMLNQQLLGKTSLLAGQSGVGKSTLLNQLIPSLDILTGQLSNATGKGKHTTTTTRLYPLPLGGFLVDSPGVWEYGLWRIPSEQLAHTFVDFRPYLGQCRFRDCQHQHEPGCAILKAVGDGAIAPFRHAAWLRLLAEQSRYRQRSNHQGKSSPVA